MLALVSMEGHALHWITWLQERRPLLTLDDVSHEILARFSSTLAINPYGSLATAKQISSVEAYIREFVEKSAQVHGWPEATFIGQFLNGLKDHIHARIRSHEAQDLYSTMQLCS